MTLFLQYRFTLTHPDDGARQVFPRTDEIEISWKRKDGQLFYLKELDTKLIFEKDDFDWVAAIETDAAKRCKPIDVKIEVLDGGTWSVLHEGVARLNRARFDFTFFTVELDTENDDATACVERNRKNAVNILDGIDKYTASTLLGYLEETTCPFKIYTNIFPSSLPTNDDCITISEGWTVKTNTASDLTLNPDNTTYEGKVITTWVRERFDNSATQPSGTGWVSLGNNNWARPPAKIFDNQNSVFNPSGGVVSNVFVIIGETEFDNGVFLSDVLAKLNPCPNELTVKSNFFGINPSGLSPNNAAYLAAENNTDNLLIWQKTDVLFADAYENATIGTLTFDEMMQTLSNMFNVRWAVIGAELVIEHYSFFESNLQGFDLKVRGTGAYIRGKYTYQYATEKINKHEKFSWQDDVQTADFAGFDIEYGDCATEEEPKRYDVKLFTTDIGYIELNPEAIEKKGFVMACVEYSTESAKWVIKRENGVLSGTELVNGHLSFSNLHDKYFRHGRLLLDGEMNNQATTFTSAIKTKRETDLDFPVEISEVLSFDASKLITTNIGNGEIETAVFSAKNRKLRVDLLHN